MRRLVDALSALGSRRATKWVFVAALGLAATSVGPERALDDWLLAERAQTGFSRALYDSFSFHDGDLAHNHELMDEGIMLPWWSEPRLRIAFWRPLAALSHYLDARAWPESGVWMHLHSLLWWSLLLAAVAVLYRRLAGTATLAGLSFALYALDDAHGSTLGWLANRNALIAGTLGVVSLILHDSWRKTKSAGHGALAIAAFGLAWAAGELAVGALAYLIAYAIFLDDSSRARRVKSVLPYLTIAAIIRFVGRHAGYAVSGSGAYVDPLTDPGRFLAGAPAKWLSLLQGQLGVIPADFSFMGAVAHRPYWQLSGALTVGAAALLLRRQLRDDRARFWLLGMALSLAPMAATFPSDRLLVFVGIGAMALLARAFAELYLESARAARSCLRGRARYAVGLGFVLTHLVLAPLCLPLRSMQMRMLAGTESRSLDHELDTANVRQPTFVILAAPSLLLANYAALRRRVQGLARPEHLYVLSASESRVRVERTGPESFTLTPEDGFLSTPLEQHYRADTRSLRVGAKIELSTVSIEVLSVTEDGRPSKVSFSLSQPRASYRFLCWEGPRFVPCDLPEVGVSQQLVTPKLGDLLMAHILDEGRSAQPHSQAFPQAPFGAEQVAIASAASLAGPALVLASVGSRPPGAPVITGLQGPSARPAMQSRAELEPQ